MCISTLEKTKPFIYIPEADICFLVSLPRFPWLHIFSRTNIRPLGCRQLNQQAEGSSVCDQGWMQARQTQFEYLRDTVKRLYDPAPIGLLQAPPIIQWHRAGLVSPPIWVSLVVVDSYCTHSVWIDCTDVGFLAIMMLFSVFFNCFVIFFCLLLGFIY